MFRFWEKKASFKCACCGKSYKGSPSLCYLKPSYFFDVPEDQRDGRVTLDSDLCHIAPDPNNSDDEEIFAMRCTLDIPIHGVKEPFKWGLWVTQSRDSFLKYLETYDEDQSNSGSFGWLAVTIPYYMRATSDGYSEHLACDVQWGIKGQRPKIILHESDHLLYSHQKQGIDWKTAIHIAQDFLKDTEH